MIVEVAPPLDGIWHIGRQGDGLLTYRRPTRANHSEPRGGNRFDSYNGDYGTLYFGSTVEVCFVETLGRFRPDPKLAALVGSDWQSNHMMGPGNIPADWRSSRVIVRVGLEQPLPFVDIFATDTIAELGSRPDVMASLLQLGVHDLDLGDIAGKDRRVTRFLAQYLADLRDGDDHPVFSGIRYVSRLGEHLECWAVFEGTELVELERISIEKNAPELINVASRYQLMVH